MIPGLSSSSSSSSHSSTSMTPSRQELNHPTSSSPTTTVLSDSETREREDLSGIDSHPVPVSRMFKRERGDPLYSEIPEWLQEFRENVVDDEIPEHGDSHRQIGERDTKTREGEDRIESDISPVLVSTTVDDRSGKPEEIQANKNPQPNTNETTIERGDPLHSEIPEWLQEFRENLVDDEIPVHGDSHASSSHEVSLEPTLSRREDL